MSQVKDIHYIHFDSIDSTNNWVKNNAHNLDPDQFTCITAQEQTAGRGRFARKWISPRGRNVYATLFFCLPFGTPHLANIGQLLASSCAMVLKQKGFDVQIKWPNDILIEGKKIAGILTETISLQDRIGVAVGIGINVDMSDEFLKTIDQPAISLAQLSPQVWETEQILGPILHQFLDDLEILKKNGFAPFQKGFNQLLAFKGKEISYFDGALTVKGICKGISSDGKLEVLLPSGKVMLISGGEIIPLREIKPA